MTRRRFFRKAMVVGLMLVALPSLTYAATPKESIADKPMHTPTSEQSKPKLVLGTTGISEDVAVSFSLPQAAFVGSLANGLDGFDFTPSGDLTVTALGWYDHEGDGLLHSHPVAIYLTATQTLVAPVANVTSASPLNTATNYRFTNVTPFGLSAGITYTIVGYGEGPVFDPYILNPSGGWIFGSGIVYQRLRTALASGIEFPTTAGEAGAIQALFSGPSFLYTGGGPVPTSHTTWGRLKSVYR